MSVRQWSPFVVRLPTLQRWRMKKSLTSVLTRTGMRSSQRSKGRKWRRKSGRRSWKRFTCCLEFGVPLKRWSSEKRDGSASDVQGSRAEFRELGRGKQKRAQGPGAYLGDVPSLHLGPLRDGWTWFEFARRLHFAPETRMSNSNSLVLMVKAFSFQSQMSLPL